VEYARDQLRLGGLRLTASRLAVLTWISTCDLPFTAEDVVAIHGKTFGRGSRSTIYRLLHLLRSQRLLARISVEQTDHAYLRQIEGHHTAICIGCRRSVLIGGCDLDAAITPSLAGSGFAIQRQELSVYGWCLTCRRTGVNA